MNARYFVPGIGRFLSADTIVPDPTNPQSLNRYSYVNNRPLNLVDPTGHYGCTADGYLEEACGPDPEDISWWWEWDQTVIRYFSIDGYGVFDKEHMLGGWTIGNSMRIQLEAMKAGKQGTTFALQRSMFGGLIELSATYSVGDDFLNLSEQEQLEIMTGIFLDFENQWERMEANVPTAVAWAIKQMTGIDIVASAWSQEDLPSNYLGFYYGVNGVSWNDAYHEIEANLGKITPLTGKPEGWGAVKNYSHEPLVNGEHVPWPGALAVEPAQSGWERTQISCSFDLCK